MVHHVVSELARSPRLDARPHPRLRTLLARPYAGFTDVTEPSGGFTLPATTSVLVIVKIRDSADRPPQFVNGVHSSSQLIEGACSPSYLEIWLEPLGAYALLGGRMDDLSGHLVDLQDVLGPGSQQLTDDVRTAPTWRRRFEIVDRFLLRRLEMTRAGAHSARAICQWLPTGWK